MGRGSFQGPGGRPVLSRRPALAPKADVELGLHVVVPGMFGSGGAQLLTADGWGHQLQNGNPKPRTARSEEREVDKAAQVALERLGISRTSGL